MVTEKSADILIAQSQKPENSQPCVQVSQTWDHDQIPLCGEPDQNLSCAFIALVSYGFDSGILQQGRVLRLGPGPVRKSKRTVGSHHNAFGMTILDKLLESMTWLVTTAVPHRPSLKDHYGQL